MKKIFITLVCLVLASSAMGQATNWNINGRPTSDWFSSNNTGRNIPLMWMRAIDPLVAAGSGGTSAGVGSNFYVDSGLATAGDGSSWANAVATFDEAVALCTAGTDDNIHIAPGHAETWSLTTSGATLDIAGINVIGYGTGSYAPTFTYTHAGATIDITVASVSMSGLRFVAGVDAVVSSISIATGGDYCTISNCEWVTPASAAFEFYDMITLAAGSDYVTIAGNTFASNVVTTGCNQAINGAALIVNRLVVVGNEFSGNFIVSGIHSTAVNLNVVIADNLFHNATTTQHAIEFTAATTGICARNLMYSDTIASTLNPGSMACFENYVINTVDLSAVRVPADPAISVQTQTAGSAWDILAKLYYASDGTGAYPATVANDSALAMIMASDNPATAASYDNTTDSLEAIADAVGALGVAGVGAYADEVVTHMDANSTASAIVADIGGISEIGDKVQADMDANSVPLAILTDLQGISQLGDKVVADMDANSVAHLAMIDIAGISEIGDKVQADMDANSVLYWQPQVSTTDADEITQDLFAVGGGPIEIIRLWGIVDVVIGANGTNAKVWLDATTATSDTDFSTSVAITDDAVGTLWTFTSANPSVLTPITPAGANGASNLMSPWICQIGSIEQLMDADPGGAGGDHITWYMVWRPLAAGVTVTPQ